MYLIALLGCGHPLTQDDVLVVPGGVDDVVDPPAPPVLTVVATAPAAFDPLFQPLAIDLVVTDGGAALAGAGATVEAHDGAEVVWTASGTTDADGALSLIWDGRAGPGFVAAGRYPLSVQVDHDDRTAEAQIEVAAVRPGFTSVALEGDGGVTALRSPLVWPLDGALQDDADPVTAIEALDDGQAPLTFPRVDLSDNMAFRPSAAEPAAFTADSRPLLVLDPAQGSPALGQTGLELVDIEVVAEGWTPLTGVPLAVGQPVVLQRDEALGTTIGVSELDVEVSFVVDDVPIGAQTLPVTIYRVLDASQFDDPAPLYRPWAPVVHQAVLGIEGTDADHHAVSDALVDWVYFDLGLVYDTDYGASAYSAYLGFSWGKPHFYLSDFLARRFGNVINCSDAGNILGAYGNMIGARLHHVIIDPPFDLNEIKAIGRPNYTSCPFGPFSCGFSYHAVTTLPGSELIWDATLALDGDANPGSSPHTELLVQSIPASEYLDRLVRSGNPRYGDMAQETIE